MSTNLEARLIFSGIKENNCELHIMKMLDRSFNVSVICLILTQCLALIGMPHVGTDVSTGALHSLSTSSNGTRYFGKN